MFKRKINITRIKRSEIQKTHDSILVERPIDLFVNYEPLANIICLPKDLKELAIGFLYSIGIIDSINDLKKIKINELNNCIYVDLNNSIDFKIQNLDINPISRVIDTTCGLSSPWRKIIKKALKDSKESIKSKEDLKISSEIIYSSMKKMQRETILFRETGGCHGAAIFDVNGHLLECKEDIGRHNAIDKVIGEAILKRQSLNKVFLTSTGRLTGDSVLKAIRAKIPIIASLSAAIESGIRLAYAYGITLIGFVRGARMNIYSHPERIVVI
ncbi:MAG: formate dehydrogenase accessory sulfurtransferase FdhD [Promethearchaeota archaeon]